MQHLQISSNLSRNDSFVSETLIYLIYGFTCLFGIAHTLSQLYVLCTKQLLPATCYCNNNCTVAIYPFLLSLNFTMPRVDVKLAALILNLNTEGTEVLASDLAGLLCEKFPMLFE